MNSKIKRIFARIICAIVGVTVLAVATISRVVAIGDAYSSMNNASYVRAATKMVRQCIALNTNTEYSAPYTVRWDDNNWFRVGSAEVGAAEEQQIGTNAHIISSSNNDGKLTCNENGTAVLTQLANVLGVSEEDFYQKIICNNGEAGIFRPTDSSKECGDTSTAYTVSDNAAEYLKSLYDAWAKDNPLATAWDDLYDVSDQDSYLTVYNDMLIACGVSGGELADSGSIAVKVVNQDGSTSTKYVTPPSGSESTKYRSSIDGKKYTCEGLANKVSELADGLKDDLENAQGKICYDDWAKRINNVTDSVAINNYRALRQQASASGDYSVWYDKANNKCVDLTDETVGTQDETTAGSTVEYQEVIPPDDARVSVEDTEECFNHGTDALGHVICPVMKFLRDGIRTIYDNTIVPFLEIDAEAFKMDSPAFKAWQIFQSMANILFVVFLLIIIFSQITGVGIDNYGIKRMLPRLIIAAVLVNLSYIICQLAVDVSNVVGYAIENMFEGLASSAMIDATRMGADISGGTSVGQAILASTVGIGGTALAITTAEFWLPSVLLVSIPALISIIVSVIFVFIILGARRAAAVILVVISPLALVCYMLPNTKKLFDRWLSAFKSVLLVFPICGLLMGGGAFAGAILMGVSQEYFIGQLLAALITVMPFFFIPRVLKASLNAVGNIGNMISNAGGILGRGASGAIRNSDGFKAAQRRAAETSTRRRAGLDANYQTTRRGNWQNAIAKSRFGRFTGYGRLQAERLAAVEKARQTDIAAQSELQGKANEYELAHPEDGEPTTSESLFKKNFLDAQHRGDVNGMYAAVEQAKRAGVQASHMAQITRNAFKEDNFGGMSDGEKSNFLREFGNRYGNDFLRKDFEQAQWARMGGMNKDGTAQANLDGYAAAGNVDIDDLKDDDVAALSGDRMSDLMRDGKITTQQAQRVWGSNQNMDDTERLILGAYQRNGTILKKSEAQDMLRTNKGRNATVTVGGENVRLSDLLERSPERVEVINVPHGNSGGGGGNGGGRGGTRMPNAGDMDPNQSGQDQYNDYNDGRGR